MTQNRQGSILAITALTIIIVIVGYYVMNIQENKTVDQKIGDAAGELQLGADKAARQLENRTPTEKLEDAATDVKNDMKKTIAE